MRYPEGIEVVFVHNVCQLAVRQKPVDDGVEVQKPSCIVLTCGLLVFRHITRCDPQLQPQQAFQRVHNSHVMCAKGVTFDFVGHLLEDVSPSMMMPDLINFDVTSKITWRKSEQLVRVLV